MTIDTNDPNDTQNYSPDDVEKVLPDNSARDNQGRTADQVADHPLITELRRYLTRYPFIGTWTLLVDYLDHSVEIRLKMFKSDEGKPPVRKSN